MLGDGKVTSKITIFLDPAGKKPITKNVMKPIIPFALLGALLAIGANAATTDPVGYITHTVFGTGVSSEALTITGPALVQPDEYVGTTAADPSGLTTLTFASGVPTTFNTGDLLEITSGAEAGWWSTIMSSTDTTVVVNDAVPAVGGNVEVAVRAHNTVLGFLGDNNPGISSPASPGAVPGADKVQFLNPSQSLTSLIFLEDAVGNSVDSMGSGWFTTGFVRSDDKVILPGTAVMFRVFSSATNLTFTSTGSVKLTPTDVDVYVGPGATEGLTFIAQTDAVGATLGETGFVDGFVKASAPTDPFDRLQFLGEPDGGGLQALVSYGAANAGVIDPSEVAFGPLPAFSVATAVAWPEGIGAIVRRDGSQADGTLTLNPSTVAP